MKKNKPEFKPFEIQPLNDDLFANLSIEELEERLELQILHITEAQICYDCGSNCSCHGNVTCGTNVCGAECVALCGAECFSLCGAHGCGGLYNIP